MTPSVLPDPIIACWLPGVYGKLGRSDGNSWTRASPLRRVLRRLSSRSLCVRPDGLQARWLGCAASTTRSRRVRATGRTTSGGSYAPFEELASVEHLGRRWLFNDLGHRTPEWSDHGNRGYTPWILRERGITLTGLAPRTFMPSVPPELLRREAAAAMPMLMVDLTSWLDIDSVAGSALRRGQRLPARVQRGTHGGLGADQHGSADPVRCYSDHLHGTRPADRCSRP